MGGHPRRTNRGVGPRPKNPGGGLANFPFHLAVVCPTAVNTKSLVMGSNGIPVRGGKLTSSFRAEPGFYGYATNSNIATCATIATRGSVDKAVPFNPATVEVLRTGYPVNALGIQTRNLLGAGGALADNAFHVVTFC